MARSTARGDADSHWGLRLLAGAFAGLVGGLAFGVLLSAPAVVNAEFFGGAGLLSQLASLLGLQGGWFHLMWVWMLHMAASILFGILFALAIPPSARTRTALLAGIAWGFLLWLVGAFLVLRTLTGTPLRIDALAWFNLAGHLVFGATLGLVYPLFDREEETVARERRVDRAVR